MHEGLDMECASPLALLVFCANGEGPYQLLSILKRQRTGALHIANSRMVAFSFFL